MPGFPCDNSGDDFIPDEMYDGVRDTIRTQRQKLGRPLTEEEIAEIYITEGLEPPGECYSEGRTYVDYGFNMEEFEEEIYHEVRGKIESKTKELGRYLTEEEIEGCFIAEGIEPPLNCYEDAYGDDEGEEGYVRIKFEPKTNQPGDDDKLGNLNQEKISTQQNSSEKLTDSQDLSPRMAEYWKLAQQTAQKYGVTATLIPQKRVPSTTTKTRFIFLEKGSDSKK